MVLNINFSVDFSPSETASSQRFTDSATYRRDAPTLQENVLNRVCCIWKSLITKLISKSNAFIITSSWRKPTTFCNKQYLLCWRKWILCWNQWKVNSFRPSEVDVLSVLSSHMRKQLSYSVVNTHKAMFFQTLPFLEFFGLKSQF